jgi:hypothetical protein
MLTPLAAPRRAGIRTVARGVLIGALALLLYGEVRPAFAEVSVGSSAGGKKEAAQQLEMIHYPLKEVSS